MLRFWKAMVAVHDCSQLQEKERTGVRFLGFSGKGECPALPSWDQALSCAWGGHWALKGNTA